MAILDLIVGGFIGTVVMTMMILYGYMMSLMPKDWNMIIDGMGKKMNDMMGVPASMAWAVHFLIGTIIHPFVYDSVWVGALGLNLGPYINEIVYAIIFAIIMVMTTVPMNPPTIKSRIAIVFHIPNEIRWFATKNRTCFHP